MNLVSDLDPQFAWDTISFALGNQVMEGLFTNDLKNFDYDINSELKIIPCLADDNGTWSSDNLNFTVSLKEGVLFHDNTTFDADDVKFTFDRLNEACNTGLTYHGTENITTQIKSLYMPIEDKFIINETIRVNQYKVKFVLNYPYSSFKGLLSFPGSSILNEYNVPAGRYYNKSIDLLEGTGPYKIIELTENRQILETFENYHRSQPDFDKITYEKYNDFDEMNQDFLNGEIHLCDNINRSMINEFEADEDIVVGENRKNTIIYYLGMNNKIIPLNIRKAISKAFDYEYLYTEIVGEIGAPMNSPVPEGILYHNPNLAPPVMNRTMARELIIEYCNNHSIDLQGLNINSTDADWFAVTDGDTPLFSYNYTYYVGNTIREDVGTLTKDSLRYIGIQVEIKNVTWPELLACLFGEYDRLELFMIGWMSDYNDPSNYVNALFSQNSEYNFVQLNNTTLENLLDESLNETDPVVRRQLYNVIQKNITEDIVPWVYLYVRSEQEVYNRELENYSLNPLRILYFYDIIFNRDIDDDGLDDELEVTIYFTDPNNPDTDSDGLLDGLEISVYFTDPNNPDSDSDELSDYDEILLYFTDPNNPDTEGDKLSDGDEILIFGTDPNINNTKWIEFGIGNDVVNLYFEEKIKMSANIIAQKKGLICLNNSEISPIYVKEPKNVKLLDYFQMELKAINLSIDSVDLNLYLNDEDNSNNDIEKLFVMKYDSETNSWIKIESVVFPSENKFLISNFDFEIISYLAIGKYISANDTDTDTNTNTGDDPYSGIFDNIPGYSEWFFIVSSISGVSIILLKIKKKNSNIIIRKINI